jgi:hypothetical protein
VLRDEVKPDALIWTGDVVPHDIWNQDLPHAARYMKALTEKFYNEMADV